MGNEFTDELQYLVTGTNPNLCAWHVEEKTGPLLGSSNGPQDAARHISRAAILYATHPNILFNDFMVDSFLYAREVVSTTNPDMDRHNNAIGKKIGIYVRNQEGTEEDIYRLTANVIQQSFGTSPNDVQHLVATETGCMQSTQKQIKLAQDLVVETAVVMPRDRWRDPAHDAGETSYAELGAMSPIPASFNMKQTLQLGD